VLPRMAWHRVTAFNGTVLPHLTVLPSAAHRVTAFNGITKRGAQVQRAVSLTLHLTSLKSIEIVFKMLSKFCFTT